MIPSNAANQIQVVKDVDLTYNIDFELGIVTGMVDGIDAVHQAIHLILNTNRFDNVIYSWGYGVELDDLLGKPIDYIYPELKRRINEALTQDNRISGTSEYTFNKVGDTVSVAFIVHTIYGDTSYSREVMA